MGRLKRFIAMIDHAEFEKLVAAVKRIEMGVVGDEAMGIKGMVQCRAEDRDRLDKLEKWQTEVKLRVAFFSGASALVVLLVKGAYDYLMAMNGKH